MLASTKIRCVVVVTSVENDRMTPSSQPRFRPSDLVPWTDPDICAMVEQLQKEVREETSTQAKSHNLHNRLEDQWPVEDLFDFDHFGEV